MKITCEHREHKTVFSLKGEFNAEAVDTFRKAVLDQMGSRVHDFVLDMSQVQLIDSKGLESLLWLSEQCVERLGQIRLAACPDNVVTILRITQLDKLLETCNDIEQALRSLEA